MTEHDPLCPVTGPLHANWCQCDLIAKVRKDEEKQWLRAVADGMVMVKQQTKADLRAKVEALPIEHNYGAVPYCISRPRVLDLIDGKD
jgi:hypothetical protein